MQTKIDGWLAEEDVDQPSEERHRAVEPLGADYDRKVREAVSTPALRRDLARHSITFFDSYYCGMRFAEHRKRWLEEMADELVEAKLSLTTNNPEKRRLLLLAPRDHGKTEAICTLAAYSVALDRGVRILIICANAGAAEKRLSRVKELLQSAKMVEDWCSEPESGFGPFSPDQLPKSQRAFGATVPPWRGHMIQVIRDTAHVDPTVEAVGMGKKITGGHFDLILLDDPEDYESTESPTQRAKHRRWLKSTLGPMLAAGGLCVCLGTRKHFDDLYSTMIRDTTWRLILDRAIVAVDGDKGQRDVGPTLSNIRARPVLEEDRHGRVKLTGWDIDKTQDVQVLWPEERPLALLLTEREGMRGDDGYGATGFAREYQNEVQDETSVHFQWEWLEAARQRGRRLRYYDGARDGDLVMGWGEDLLIVQGVDPAFVTDPTKAEANNSDYAVTVTWAANVKTRERILLSVHRARGRTALEKKRDVIREYARWGPPPGEFGGSIAEYVTRGWCFAAAMEVNSAGLWQQIGVEEASDIPMTTHWTGANKRDQFVGVPALATLFEQGKVTLPDGDPETRAMTDLVVEEFHQLGRARHDDIVMAVWIAEVLLRRALDIYDKLLDQNAEAA